MVSRLSVPGSEILWGRSEANRPDRNFLLHQQGFFSGKTEGDLDSVPGFYGGTASYRFVQNAKALNKLRVNRAYKNAALMNAPSNVPKLEHGLTPSAARIAAYQHARKTSLRKVFKSKARGKEEKRAFAELHRVLPTPGRDVQRHIGRDRGKAVRARALLNRPTHVWAENAAGEPALVPVRYEAGYKVEKDAAGRDVIVVDE